MVFGVTGDRQVDQRCVELVCTIWPSRRHDLTDADRGGLVLETGGPRSGEAFAGSDNARVGTRKRDDMEANNMKDATKQIDQALEQLATRWSADRARRSASTWP